MNQDLLSIAIHDDFIQINKEYKKFKHITFDQMCEKNQQTLDIYEVELISSIKSLIQEDQDENTEDNRIRALIGARVLTKYSIMNQDECVKFFTQIGEHIPISIDKRLFFFKSISKVINDKNNYLWDRYLLQFQKKILSTTNDNLTDETTVINSILYIDSLIQYAPNFLSKFSKKIISYLIKIIRAKPYKFDVNYDILTKTNQTIDQYFSGENSFYSNNGIELLRKILKKKKSDTFEVDQILIQSSEQKIKTLEILSAIIECGNKSFLDNNYELIRSFLNKEIENESNPQNLILIARNSIYLMKKEENLNEKLSHFLFSSENESDSDPNIIIGKLENMKILILTKHFNQKKAEIVNFASKFIENTDLKLHNKAFEVIDTFCRFCDSNDAENFIIKSEHRDQFFRKIDFKYKEVVKLSLDDTQTFVEKLSESINENPLETLLSLNDNKTIDDEYYDDDDDDNNKKNVVVASASVDGENEEEEEDSIIDFLRDIEDNNYDEDIVQPIFEQINSHDSNVRSLVPLILIKLKREIVFTNDYLQVLFDKLVHDPSEKVKQSIVYCFNHSLKNCTNINYVNLVQHLNANAENIFNLLILGENINESLRKSTILFMCFSSRLDVPIIKSKLENFYSITTDFDIKSSISKKIANDSQYLPYIVESNPTLCNQNFEKMINFIKQSSTVSKEKKTQFQQRFYSKIFCSYSEILKIILENNPELLEKYTEDIINTSIKCLNKKMREKETLNVLQLLEQSFYFIGVDKTIELNDKKLFNSETNLFNIIFNTASRFVSTKINKVVFRILGFIGPQLLYKKQKIVNLKPTWRTKIKYEISNISKKSVLIIYASCSKILFDILRDQTKSDLHFKSLKILINIQERIKMCQMNTKYEFKQAFNIFKEMLKNSSNDMKNKYVPLLESFIRFDSLIINQSIPELVDYLIKLWRFGSCNILRTFVGFAKFKVLQSINKIYPLILSMDDPIDNLILVYKKYANEASFKGNVIQNLIDMVNVGKYLAFRGLNELIPIAIDLDKYIPSIVKACLQVIKNTKKDDVEDEISKKLFDDSIEVLITLSKVCQNNDVNKAKFEECLPSILDAVPSFLDELSRPYDNQETTPTTASNTTINDDDELNRKFNEAEFIKLITSIKNASDQEYDRFNEWLYELNRFCIERSPSIIIRKIFPIAETSPSIALSIFDVSFYSCINKFNQKSEESDFKEKVKPITETFIHLLKNEKLPYQVRTILLHLVEFQDKACLPIITLEDFSSLERLISTIFASNPGLSLRFALLNYYKYQDETNAANQQSKQKAQADLEQAYLNNGFLEEYQNFLTASRDASNNSYMLPINANTIEIIHQLQSANQFFLSGNWNHFNNEIEMISRKSITHLFRTASLIEQCWNENAGPSIGVTGEFNKKVEILKEIDLGFEALGEESRTIFSSSATSIVQSLIYSQQLVELKEMFLSNGSQENFKQRFLKEENIVSFVPPILLLRIESKGNNKNSLSEKVGLLSIFRQRKNWKLMDKYFNHFFGSSTEIPVEVIYEMMYSKLANNLATEEEFDSLLSRISLLKESGKRSDLQSEEYQYSTLEKFVKYQKAQCIAHSFNNTTKFKEVLSLCKDFDYSEAVNLWSWTNLKLFEIENNINYFTTEEEEDNDDDDNIDNKSSVVDKYYKQVASKKPRFDSTRNTNSLLKSKAYPNINYSYLMEAIRGYIRSTNMKDKMVVPNIVTIVSLLFKYFPNNNCINEIKNELDQIPLHFYLESIQMIISYINQIRNDDFGNYIINLLIDIMRKYPQGVIYDYSFSLFCDQRRITKNELLLSPIEKVKKHFIEHPEELSELKCQNIFNEVFQLTKNLYKISISIVSILSGFLRYANEFMLKDISKYDRSEIISFTNDLEYMNNEYIVPFCKYIRKEKNVGEYEPSKSEETAIKKLLKDEIKAIENDLQGEEITEEIIEKNKNIKNMDHCINDLHTSITQLINDIYVLKCLNKKKSLDNRRILSKKAQEKLSAVKPLKAEKVKLTESENKKSTHLFEPIFDDDDDYDYDADDDRILDQIESIESSDSIETTITHSLPYVKENKSTVLLYDNNDNYIKDTKIYDPKDERKHSQKIEIVQHSTEDLISKKTKKVDFDKKLNERDNKISQLKTRIRNDKLQIILIQNKISKLYSLFSLQALKVKIEREMVKENPEMAKMENLSLPVFGTFNHEGEKILIQKFENKYTEMDSLIRPRNVVIIGSDGKRYSFMLKSTEDLRVDQRIMTLFRFMNKFLRTRIKTYSITPLTVQFGVIQFVENTKRIDDFINESRRRNPDKTPEEIILKEDYLKPNDLKEYDNKSDELKRYIFNSIINRTKGYELYLREALYYIAPDTETWAKYTVNFTNSCAVTSIVGYIIGIGDRHIKNILMSLIDGYLVHIDFADCFEVDQHRRKAPEKVPFRLTRNIVAMLGPCGINGCFRSKCEECLELIRENRELIFSILEVFYISPVQKQAGFRDMRRHMVDIRNESSKKEFVMKRIKMKLDGTDKTITYDEKNVDVDNEPMSVQEHVDKLINCAINPDNLACSFHGWRPWI